VLEKLTGTAVLVFARAPVNGQCKTRLIPALGQDGATALHAAMIRHTLMTAARAGIGPVELWCTPSPDHPFFIDCRKQQSFTLHQQHGQDLGARMANAMEHALHHYQQVILIGTDCPTLNENYLRLAQQQLEAGCDAVIGPAVDGGYILIALRRTEPALFEAIDWGTDVVLHQTRQRLSRLNYHWQELAALRDIDEPDDLRNL
jgi:rSAM/selenodomain-associated transferase 1